MLLFFNSIFLDRYYAISQPLRYIPIRTHRLILLSILSIQLLAGLVSAPALATPSSGLVFIPPPGQIHQSSTQSVLNILSGNSTPGNLERKQVSTLLQVNSTPGYLERKQVSTLLQVNSTPGYLERKQVSTLIQVNSTAGYLERKQVSTLLQVRLRI